MVTPLKPIESENTVEEIAAYNQWLSTATAEMSVRATGYPIKKEPEYPCANADMSDCYPAVEANLTVTYDGDKFPKTEGYEGTLFLASVKESFNFSVAVMDAAATMYPLQVTTCVPNLFRLD